MPWRSGAVLFKGHLSSSFRPGLPQQAQWVGSVAVPSTLRKVVGPFVDLPGRSVPADGGGRLKLTRWDPHSRHSVLLPTEQQGVVPIFLGTWTFLWKPLQNGRRKIPSSFCTPGSLPSPSLHPPLAGPTDPSPRLHGCLGCISVLRWQPTGKSLRLGVTGEPLWKT